MPWLIYNLLLLAALAGGLPFLLFKIVTVRRFRTGLGERFTIYRSQQKLRAEKSIWLQAASVGEVSASLPLLRLLQDEYPDHKIVLTCQTASSRQLARERLSPSTVVVLCPLDLGFLVRRFIHLISPRILILVETELWPGLITVSREQNIPIVMVSGRISRGGLRKYMRLAFAVRPLLQKVTVFNMRTEEDAARIRRMGAPREKVFVTGNIKFDSLPSPTISPEVQRQVIQPLGLKSDTLLVVGGSTFKGEESVLLEAFKNLSPRFPELRLLLAPRHIERVGEIEELLKSQNQPYSRFTRLADEKEERKKTVIILDKMGILFSLYSRADVVFVGRSLRGEGGQNPIEPASWGKPLIFGPHMENFEDIAADLVRSGGAAQIADDSELEAELLHVLSHPDQRSARGEKAYRVVVNHRGASLRNLGTIKRLLAKDKNI